jgi:outer membrane protein OmpA-like peptidoglycan-associated protein
MAQVSVNPGALDQLSPSPPATHGEHKAAPHHPVHRAPAHTAHPGHATHTTHPVEHPEPAKHAPPPPAPEASLPPVRLAPAPPPAAVLPPPVVAPQPRPAPVQLAPVVPDAVGQATQIPGGLRVTFGPGKADLNPQTDAALLAFAHTIAADPSATVNVYAYAAGTPDDPSTPRRLSLSRALAARAVLINQGIASARIYPRALGATPSDGPPDRVDVTQVGIAPPVTPPNPSPPPPTAPPATR